MTRLTDQQYKDLVEALQDLLDEAYYDDKPAEYLVDVLSPMIEGWLEEAKCKLTHLVPAEDDDPDWW